LAAVSGAPASGLGFTRARRGSAGRGGRRSGGAGTGRGAPGRRGCRGSGRRSEEHTSELQSLTNLVCRLLLEKKKQKVMSRQGTLIGGQRRARREAAKPAAPAEPPAALRYHSVPRAPHEDATRVTRPRSPSSTSLAHHPAAALSCCVDVSHSFPPFIPRSGGASDVRLGCARRRFRSSGSRLPRLPVLCLFFFFKYPAPPELPPFSPPRPLPD